MFGVDDPELLAKWVKSYAFTFAVEMPFFVWLSRQYVPKWRGALAGMAGTAFTHPLLWFVWPPLVIKAWRALLAAARLASVSPFLASHVEPYSVYVATGEVLVCIIESLTFFALARPIPFWQAVAASFIANAASYGFGQLVRAIGVPI
jgi:hypothetical protein